MVKKISFMVLISILFLGCSPSTEAKYTKDFSQGIPEKGQKLPIEAEIKIGETTLELEVANTPEQQQIGLMYRKSLAENRGMIFVFPQIRPLKFWMKNVDISLDMIFLNNGRVKAVLSNVPPCTVDPCPSYGPDDLTNQVIELRGGRAAELGIKEGDQLEIEFLERFIPKSSKHNDKFC
jgi:uncharacterized membrane protein (UPF0127 family)